MIRVLFLGDVVGKVGRKVLKEGLKQLAQTTNPALIVANGENAAGGLGLDPSTADEIFKAGVQYITSGNHIWNKREIAPLLNAEKSKIVRPANYPLGAPGRGVLKIELKSGTTLAIVNLIGRVFMPDLVDCPFRAADKILTGELEDVKLIFVDFHAEATSEKVALGYYLDGRVSAVVGTHTHVQTADERILPQGTAYISDVGMCGPEESVIGMKHDLIIERFISGRPQKFETASGDGQLNAVTVDIDETTGRAEKIQRHFIRHQLA